MTDLEAPRTTAPRAVAPLRRPAAVHDARRRLEHARTTCTIDTTSTTRLTRLREPAETGHSTDDHLVREILILPGTPRRLTWRHAAR
ncbi:hypothetical protein [Streptomyces sp. YIM S03343]